MSAQRGPESENDAAFSLSRPRSGDVPSAVETNGDESSGFVFVVRFVVFRGHRFVDGVPALATGPRGTTSARNGERGATTPDRRCSGNRGGGINAAILANQCTGVITRCVAPLRLGFRRRYATRPSGRIDRRSKRNGGRPPYRQSRSSPSRSPGQHDIFVAKLAP
jgi:hypothetical protein